MQFLRGLNLHYSRSKFYYIPKWCKKWWLVNSKSKGYYTQKKIKGLSSIFSAIDPLTEIASRRVSTSLRWLLSPPARLISGELNSLSSYFFGSDHLVLRRSALVRISGRSWWDQAINRENLISSCCLFYGREQPASLPVVNAAPLMPAVAGKFNFRPLVWKYNYVIDAFFFRLFIASHIRYDIACSSFLTPKE